jgi:hypothetical protein
MATPNKNAGVAEALQACGCSLMLLPFAVLGVVIIVAIAISSPGGAAAVVIILAPIIWMVVRIRRNNQLQATRLQQPQAPAPTYNVACPKCGTGLVGPEGKVRCANCGKAFRVIPNR